jgi:predicted nucleotidyltransferase
MQDWTTSVAASWIAWNDASQWSDLGFREVAEDTSSMCIGKGLIVSGPPQQERPPDLGSLRATRGQILAAASQRGLRDVRVFGSVARGEAVETSDVDLLVAPGPDTTLFDLSGFALDVEEIVGRHVDVATPRGLKARIRDRVLAEAVAL